MTLTGGPVSIYSVPDPDNAHDVIAEGTLGDLLQQLVDGVYPAWDDGEPVTVVITARSHVIRTTGQTAHRRVD